MLNKMGNMKICNFRLFAIFYEIISKEFSKGRILRADKLTDNNVFFFVLYMIRKSTFLKKGKNKYFVLRSQHSMLLYLRIGYKTWRAIFP